MGGTRSPRSGSEAVTPPANGCAAAARQTALGSRVSVGQLQLGEDWRVQNLTESLSSTCLAALLRWLPCPWVRAEGWGSLGSSLQTLGRGNPGNSKGLSQTPKYPTPKLQFTPDLDCVGDCRGKTSSSRGKRRIFLLLAAAAVEGGAHNMAGTKKAEGRSEREE